MRQSGLSMAAIVGPGGPSMATKFAIDGPGGSVVAGDHHKTIIIETGQHKFSRVKIQFEKICTSGKNPLYDIYEGTVLSYM